MEINSKSVTIRVFSVAILVVAVSLLSWFAFQSKGPHDGKVNKVENFYIEMKNDANLFHAWLYDNNFKPLTNNGITGDVKFFLMDSTTFDVALKPFLEDEFICESIPGFYICKITFNISGNSITSTFQNPVQVAQDK